MGCRPDQPDGTFYFNNQPNMLDQFLVNKNMAADGSPLRVLAATIDILRFPGMTDRDYPKPIPFGGMGDPVNQAGFSDHFPIAMHVIGRLTHPSQPARHFQPLCPGDRRAQAGLGAATKQAA
jgi:hypothetical protein